MNKKCSGCGKRIDNNHELCESCFSLIHYGKHTLSLDEEIEFGELAKEINSTNSLVVLVLDILNMPRDLDVIKNNIKNNILVVLTKKDVLPKYIKDDKLLDYVDNYKIKYIDKEIVSSKNNYHLDELKNKIIKYKTDKVYIIGYTNAGKSSLINKLIYNYTDSNVKITTSYFTSTTINTIEIKFNDFILIDTPGMIIDSFPYDKNDKSILKKVNPSMAIIPRTYPIKIKQSFIIDNILKLDIDVKNEITFYISNDLVIKRLYKDNDFMNNLEKYEITVKENEDIVITNLGFINIKRKGLIIIYALKGTNIYTRKALI